MFIDFFSCCSAPETEDEWDDVDFEDHINFKKRIKKTMYRSSKNRNNRPSLSLTELAVDYMNRVSQRGLGKVDMYWISSVCSGTYISSCTLMMALIYAKRLKTKDSEYLDNVSSTDLFLVSMMVASKYLIDEGEDEDIRLKHWLLASRSCGNSLEAAELHDMEREFLSAIEWDVHVSNNEFWSFLMEIEQRIAWRKYLARNQNFFTYTDVDVLTSTIPEIKNSHHDGDVGCNTAVRYDNDLAYDFGEKFALLCLDFYKVTAYCTAAYILGVCSLAITPTAYCHMKSLNMNLHPPANPTTNLTIVSIYEPNYYYVGDVIGVKLGGYSGGRYSKLDDKGRDNDNVYFGKDGVGIDKKCANICANYNHGVGVGDGKDGDVPSESGENVLNGNEQNELENAKERKQHLHMEPYTTDDDNNSSSVYSIFLFPYY